MEWQAAGTVIGTAYADVLRQSADLIDTLNKLLKIVERLQKQQSELPTARIAERVTRYETLLEFRRLVQGQRDKLIATLPPRITSALDFGVWHAGP